MATVGEAKRTNHPGYMKVLDRPVSLIAIATGIAAVSFLFHVIAPTGTLLGDLILGYAPVLLGCVSMFLLVRARRKVVHRGRVTIYAVILSPFAFSYPAWILILLVYFTNLVCTRGRC